MEEKTVETKTGNEKNGQNPPAKKVRRSVTKQYNPKKYRGKKLKVRFSHIEFPKSELHFTYRGVGYKLEDQEEITLPIEVIEHLNSLAVPERKYEEDSVTGQIKPGPVVMRHRFSCIPVNIGQFVK